MLVAAWSRRWLVVTVVLVLVVAALVPVAAAVDDDGLEVGAGLPSVDPPPAVDPEETGAVSPEPGTAGWEPIAGVVEPLPAGPVEAALPGSVESAVPAEAAASVAVAPSGEPVAPAPTVEAAGADAPAYPANPTVPTPEAVVDEPAAPVTPTPELAAVEAAVPEAPEPVPTPEPAPIAPRSMPAPPPAEQPTPAPAPAAASLRDRDADGIPDERDRYSAAHDCEVDPLAVCRDGRLDPAGTVNWRNPEWRQKRGWDESDLYLDEMDCLGEPISDGIPDVLQAGCSEDRPSSTPTALEARAAASEAQRPAAGGGSERHGSSSQTAAGSPSDQAGAASDLSGFIGGEHLVRHEKEPGLWVPPGLERAPAVDVTRDRAQLDRLKWCGDTTIPQLATGPSDAGALTWLVLCFAGAKALSSIAPADGRDQFVVQGDPDDPDQWWMCERDAGCQRFDPGAFPVAALDREANPLNAHLSVEVWRQVFDILFTDNPRWWPVRKDRMWLGDAFYWMRRGFTWDGCEMDVDLVRHCVDPQVAPSVAVTKMDNVIRYSSPEVLDDEDIVRHERRHVSHHAMFDRNLGVVSLLMLDQGPRSIARLFGVIDACFSPVEMAAGETAEYMDVCVPVWDDIKWLDGRPILDMRPTRFDLPASPSSRAGE